MLKVINDYINNVRESVRIKTISQLLVAEAPGFVHSMSDEWRDGYIELTPGGAATLSCRYTCHVTNRLGSVSRTYIVHVAGIHFSISFSALTLLVGSFDQ